MNQLDRLLEEKIICVDFYSFRHIHFSIFQVDFVFFLSVYILFSKLYFLLNFKINFKVKIDLFKLSILSTLTYNKYQYQFYEHL